MTAEQAERIRKALDISEQFMLVATDWNLDEVEIDGKMRRTHDLIQVIRAAKAEFEAALRAATEEK